MEYLYHGSHTADIVTLEARSRLHNAEKNVVYLTDSIPYALLYIWDENHNHYSRKHVTAGIKNGLVVYEEQFPDQLETFYKGVSGFIYCIPKTSNFQPVDDRENMFYSTVDAIANHVVFVSDVYAELLKYEESGEFKVLRYNEQTEKRQDELIDMIASFIVKSEFFKNDKPHADFMKRYFINAWEKAVSTYSNAENYE